MKTSSWLVCEDLLPLFPYIRFTQTHTRTHINGKLPAILLCAPLSQLCPPNLQQIQYKLYIQSQTQFPSVHLFSLSTPGGRFSHRFYSIIISANKLSPYVIPMVLPLFHFTFSRPSLSLFALAISFCRFATHTHTHFLAFTTFLCIPVVTAAPLFRPGYQIFFILFWLFGFSFSIAYINNNLTSFIHFY